MVKQYARGQLDRSGESQEFAARHRDWFVGLAERELGISDNTLQGWKLQLDKTPENPFPGIGNPRDPEMARLQKENARLKEENEILKQAMGIFTPRLR